MSRPISSESVFRAIADPARRRILEILRRGDRPPMKIAQSFRFRLPTLTFHLRVLTNAGLVSQSRRGSQRFYRLHPRLLHVAVDWLRQFEMSRQSARSANGLRHGRAGAPGRTGLHFKTR